MSDNLRIWTAVSKTNPNNTKKVEFGRKFTSIDAHSQIQSATAQFGPVGIGWGYDVAHSVLPIKKGEVEYLLCFADVTLWHTDRVNKYGPWRGAAELTAAKDQRLDDDAPKKAMTDALTKGLSHLGFNADVFMGLFDDNKYVQKVEAEFKNAPKLVEAPKPSVPEVVIQEFRDTIMVADSVASLDLIVKDWIAKGKVSPRDCADMGEAYKVKRSFLNNPDTAMEGQA